MPVIDFPNAPTNGDELQAPNKFVYRWVDDNRWKNIHRPLIIPDYVWPDLSDPDDPWGDGSTPPGDSDQWPPGGPDSPIDGGGGDDWILEAIDFTVGTDEANIVIPYVVNIDGSTGSYNTNIRKIANFTLGPSAGAANPYPDADGVAKTPLIAFRGQTFANRHYWGQAEKDPDPSNTILRNPGDRWLTSPQQITLDYNANYPASIARLSDILSPEGYANKTDVQFRLRATGRQISWTFPGVIFRLDVIQATASGVSIGGAPISAINWDDTTGTRNVDFAREGAWATVTAGCEFLELRGRCDAGFEIGNIILEIKDPNGPAVADKPPIAFCCNPDMTFSIASFSDTDVGETFGTLQSYEHRNPGRLDNTVLDQVVNVNTIGDAVTNVTQNRPITCIEMTENGGHLFWVFEDTPRVVHKRHLLTPYDITTHSWTAAGDDFRNYSSYTPTFGYDIKDFKINPEQTRLYVLSTGDLLRDYTISTPGDLSTVDVFSPNTTVDMTAFGPAAMDISHDGHVIIFIKTGKVKQLIMDTAYDLSTTFDSGFERDFFLQNPVDICVNADASSIMVLDVPDDTTETGYTLYNYTRNI